MAALNGAPEETGEQDIEESDGDGTSSESCFGVAEVKQKKKGKLEAVAKGKSGRKTDPVKTEVPDKSDRAMERAGGVASSLESLSPLMMWQGSAKEKDCAARASKALALAETLSKEGRPEAKSMADKLKTLSETVERNLELLTALRPEEAGSTVAACGAFDSIFLQKVANLPADCLMAVLSDWGKKILEDSVPTCHFLKL